MALKPFENDMFGLAASKTIGTDTFPVTLGQKWPKGIETIEQKIDGKSGPILG